jgi:hypothetical protein
VLCGANGHPFGIKWVQFLFLVHKPYWNSCYKYKSNLYCNFNWIYYVSSTSTTGCTSSKKKSIPFGNTITNPVTRPTADQIVTCPNNGKDLPNIFFVGNCKATDRNQYYRCIFNRVAKLNEATCPSTAIANCANENFADSCGNTVATGQNQADTAGQFRVVLKYSRLSKCFYFNVYKNTLNPTVDTNDIICTTAGRITVGGFLHLDMSTVSRLHIKPLIFYHKYSRYLYSVTSQVGVATNPCIFEVENILIRLRNFTVQNNHTTTL